MQAIFRQRLDGNDVDTPMARFAEAAAVREPGDLFVERVVNGDVGEW